MPTAKRCTYATTVIGFGNHAAIEIPDEVLTQLGANRRAPLKITVNGYTYQSTATGVDGVCMVVFPMRDRKAAGVKARDRIKVTLELDTGYRIVELPPALQKALRAAGLTRTFRALTYSKRKELARRVAEAKAEDTRKRRIEKIIAELRGE